LAVTVVAKDVIGLEVEVEAEADDPDTSIAEVPGATGCEDPIPGAAEFCDVRAHVGMPRDVLIASRESSSSAISRINIRMSDSSPSRLPWDVERELGSGLDREGKRCFQPPVIGEDDKPVIAGAGRAMALEEGGCARMVGAAEL